MGFEANGTKLHTLTFTANVVLIMSSIYGYAKWFRKMQVVVKSIEVITISFD